MTPTQGVLTFAFGTSYLRQAYCQALTVRKNLDIPMSVVFNADFATDLSLLKKLGDIANLIPIRGKYQKFEYESQALELSPYDITFKTDADVLFPSGSSLYLPDHLPASSGVACDVRGVACTSAPYREVESSVGAPPIYSACFAFDKRTSQAGEFFSAVGHLFRNWFNLMVWEKTEKVLPPTTDSVYSLAWLKVFGHNRIEGNEFIHAKPQFGNLGDAPWTQTNLFLVDDHCRMYMDGVRLCKPFHYYDKSLTTPAFIERLEHVCSVRQAEPSKAGGRKRRSTRKAV